MKAETVEFEMWSLAGDAMEAANVCPRWTYEAGGIIVGYRQALGDTDNEHLDTESVCAAREYARAAEMIAEDGILYGCDMDAAGCLVDCIAHLVESKAAEYGPEEWVL